MTALEPEKDHRTGPLFKRRDGRGWGQIRTVFEKAVERAKLTGFRFHDLRHTAARPPRDGRGDAPGGEGDPRARGHLDDQDPSAHQLAHDARIDANRLVNSRAPVAQSDRARVS